MPFLAGVLLKLMNFKVTAFGTYHIQVEYIRLLASGSTIHISQ